jgi:hypothetical protein
MDSSFGPFDAFAFAAFAVLIAVATIVIVKLGQLPGQLARKWGHPQASAINAAGWIGIATGGLVWPVAFIWAFTTPRSPAPTPAPATERQAISPVENLPGKEAQS